MINTVRNGGIFMSLTRTNPKWTLASVALTDAYTDFVLSCQAMNCTPATLEFYKNPAGAFLSWVENMGVTDPAGVTARYVQQYLKGTLEKLAR